MAIERFWERQGPVFFTAPGGEDGLITVSSVECFKVKQQVVIEAVGQPVLRAEIKRVISSTQLLVGPTNQQRGGSRSLKTRIDVSLYTNVNLATIRAEEQPKAVPTPEDIIKASYEQEPTLAIRSFLVDKIGRGYTTSNPFPVVVSNPQSSNNSVIYTEYSTITDTTETIVATFTALSNNTNIKRLLGDAHTFGIWKIYKDSVSPSNLQATYRTSPTKRTADLYLDQPEPRNSGEQIVVTFQAERYRTNLLSASSDTFVRLEGFTP